MFEEATQPQRMFPTSDRLRAMHKQCWVRRGNFDLGGCPCAFEHLCRVPTKELQERLAADSAAARQFRNRTKGT